MVSTKDIYPTGGSGAGFLKPADIEDDKEVTIEGYEIRSFKDFGPGGTPQNRIVLTLKDEEKTFRLNATNVRRIEAAYGEEVDDWIGRKLILYVDQVRNPAEGGMVDSVCVRIPKAWHGLRTKVRPKYDEINPPPEEDIDTDPGRY